MCQIYFITSDSNNNDNNDNSVLYKKICKSKNAKFVKDVAVLPRFCRLNHRFV